MLSALNKLILFHTRANTGDQSSNQAIDQTLVLISSIFD